MKLYNNKYEALQAAKWLKKNLNKSLKTVEELSEDITQFENKLNADMLLRVVEWVALIRFLFGVCHY